MKISILAFCLVSAFQPCAQNLVVNPGAENLPRGTGWTIISTGALTCLSAPTDNIVNWTMKPDGSSNYPYDHTTGTSGGTVFFSGCDTYLQGPFELQQMIDISADASGIDAGTQVYFFMGYMQTPVSPQTDEGRYVIQFLNAANTVLSTGYSSSWQSNSGGSGTAWKQYTATPTAPVGARKALIRLQTQLYFNRPAINVYFDDISFSRIMIVPLGLRSFTAAAVAGNVHLKWFMSNELNGKHFFVERSTDGVHYNPVASIEATGKLQYDYSDKIAATEASNYYYRLRITCISGEVEYSKVVLVCISQPISYIISPNPAVDRITIRGLSKPGSLSIIDYRGCTVFHSIVNSASFNLDINNLPAGLYIVRYSYKSMSIDRKLVIMKR